MGTGLGEEWLRRGGLGAVGIAAGAVDELDQAHEAAQVVVGLVGDQAGGLHHIMEVAGGVVGVAGHLAGDGDGMPINGL